MHFTVEILIEINDLLTLLLLLFLFDCEASSSPSSMLFTSVELILILTS